MSGPKLHTDERGLTRCAWSTSDPLYLAYHDTEWGFPTVDDTRLFEKICLEGFQAGLSWLTILRERDNFRAAFHDFDFKRVARMTGRDVQRLLQNTGIVRHRGKIESTINNAQRAIELIEEHGSLAAYVWGSAPSAPDTLKMTSKILARPTSPQSIAMSKDLKKRGWTYVGPTTIHAFMQAMGLFNHHLDGCWVRQKAIIARSRLRLPPRA